MAWTISGRYLASCSCREVCPCAHDGPPDHPSGTTDCFGGSVFVVERGNLDDVDLSGVKFGVFNHFPSNFTSGNWKIGAFVDQAASEEQAQAIEKILSGQAGGPFADMAPLIGEFLGVQRAEITYSDGDTPSGSIAGQFEVRFSPYRAPDGTPTTIKNAAYGFAPEYTIGKGSGRADAFGGAIAYDAIYGEAAEFTYSSERHDVRPRA